MNKKSTWAILILSLSFLLSTYEARAWISNRYHGHYYHGGYYHGGYHNNYYYNHGWSAHGVVIGVPAGAYYGYGCRLIQKCYPNGGCINHRICE